MRNASSIPMNGALGGRAPGRAMWAVAFGLVGLLAGCAGESTFGPGSGQPTFVRTDYFDVTRSSGLVFVERNDSTLVFERVEDVSDPPVGKLIVGAEDGGYIGRVRWARREGRNLIVRIDPAWAVDVVYAGAADTSFALTFGSILRSTAGSEAAPFELVESVPGVRVSSEGLDLAGATLFAGTAGGNDLSVKITQGRISYAPLLAFGFALSPGGAHRAGASLAGEYALELEASIEAGGPVSLDENIVLAAMRRDIVMRIGGFPVAARVTLRYRATVRLEGDFSPATAWASAASGWLEFGARREAGTWRKLTNESIVFSAPAVALPETREARSAIAVWPELAIEYYGEPTMETRCEVVPEYRAARGSAPVIEWEELGSVKGAFAFRPGRLARLPFEFETVLRERTTTLAAGPFKTDRYILLGQWGSEGTTDGTFGYPKGIAIDAGSFVYVIDNWRNRIQKFTPEGDLVLAWGEPGTGEGQLDGPERIAIDAEGFVYVTDSGNKRVQRFTSAGQYLSSWGSEGTGDGQFLYPLGVAVGNGSVFVTDNLAHRVQRFSVEGTYLSQWGSAGAAEGSFNGPAGCAALPGGEGRLCVADCRNNRIQAFAFTGAFEDAWGSGGAGDGQFDCPIDVAVDAAGNVYACDLGNDRFQVFSPSGSFIAALGSSGPGEGQFDHPEGIAVDAQGNVYVVDGRNRRVQVFAPLAP